MSKLIILPNFRLIPKGGVIHLDINLLKYSLCDILLLNKIYISHICEKLGKCNTCKIKIIEGFNSINKIEYEEKETLNNLKNIKKYKSYRLSCQVYIKKNSNLIIDIIDNE